MARIIGGKALSDRLKRMTGPELQRHVGQALFAAGQQIQVEAQLSITRGAVSGKNHVPSKPGDPPNQDTGVLGNNIETVQISPLRVEVSSNAPYATALEYGTSKMAPRPYMKPAAQKVRPKVTELVAIAVRRAKGRT
jgi:HK97 gp10 family phage protein